MSHFTYDECLDKTSLRQGDVLSRTPSLDEILKNVHPHYHSSQSYKHFIILTQTCDLVPRDIGGRICKSRYITIAAVRPLKLTVERELERLMRKTDLDFKLGVTVDKTKSTLSNFVERLLNNNEDDFFYLESDTQAGLLEDSCAFLHLSIALKSELHYNTLLESKILQLRVDFQHKLGYQVGKSYSRVATEDWVPGALTEKDFRRKISSVVKGSWNAKILDPKLYQRIIQKASEEEDLNDPSAILEKFISEIETEKKERRALVMQEIKESLESVGIEPGLVRKGIASLTSNPHFKAILNRGLE